MSARILPSPTVEAVTETYWKKWRPTGPSHFALFTVPLPNGLMTISAGSRSVRFVILVTGAGVVDELMASLVIYKYTNNQLHVNQSIFIY